MLVDVPDFVLFFGRFHPLIVHLPIGFLLLAGIVAFLSKRPKFRPLEASLDFILLLGAISAVVACVLGFMLSQGGDYHADTLFWHQWLGIGLAIISVVLYGSRVAVQQGRSRFTKFNSPYAFLAILVLLTFTGHFGANLTHGSTYLFQYAPDPLRIMAGMEPKAVPRPPVTVLDSADIFLDVIHPVIQSKCNSCHNSDKTKGQLLLTSYNDMLQGGKEGPSLVPGDLEKSLMFQRVILPSTHDDYMPAEGKTGLTDDELALLEWWITNDAPPSMQLAFMKVTSDISPKFERVLGIAVSSDSRLPKTEVTAADSSSIKAALAEGFVIKRIIPESNFLEVRLPFTGQNLSTMQLQALLPLKGQIAWLDFSQGQVTDANLALIGQLTSLTRLNLSNNELTDEGINHLVNLDELTYLNLYGSSVSDASLTILKNLPSLKSLYLWLTEVTDTGITSLKSERPDIKITLGEELTAITEKDSTETIER
jgi:uncharacterized membrane protein